MYKLRFDNDMERKDTKEMTDKEKLKTVFRLLYPIQRRCYNRKDDPIMQEVTFEVTENGELSSLIITCILTMELHKQDCQIVQRR